MLSPTQSEPPLDALPARKAPTVRPADLKNDKHPNGRSSVGKRALITLVRFLIIVCIGVSAAFAWQSYGPVRKIIASSSPHLSWLAPEAKPVPRNVPDLIGMATRTASSPDEQQPNAISLGLDAVRQATDRIATRIAFNPEQMTSSADRIATRQEQMMRSLDRIATSQEQMMRSLDQFTADQGQMTREITKLQEIEQSIRSQNSEPAPRPVSASSPKPRSRPASAAKPVSRPASAPAAEPLFRGPSQEPVVR
jgi:hypothetical protein